MVQEAPPGSTIGATWLGISLVFVGGVATGFGSATALALSPLFRYKPEKVWKFHPQKGIWGAVNQPTAGARSSAILPRGEHAVQLYSLGTPNGMKVTCLLEELCLRYGVEYDAWAVDIGAETLGQFESGFVEVNPNSKVPALLHWEDGSARATRVFESAAIMMHLCEVYDKDGAFLPVVGDPRRTECLSWLFWVQGSAPFLGGGFGHFYHYAPTKIRYAIDRYAMETKRQLDVLERQLAGLVRADLGEAKSKFAGGPYLCGDEVTVADLCCYPWYGRFVQGKLYGNSAEFLQTREEYPHVVAWAVRMGDRDGVRRGCMVNRSKGDEGLPVLRERHSSKDFDAVGAGIETARDVIVVPENAPEYEQSLSTLTRGRFPQGSTLKITVDDGLPVLREQHSSEDFEALTDGRDLQGPTLAITGDEGLPALREQHSSEDFEALTDGRDLQGPTLAITGDEGLPVLREQHSSEDFVALTDGRDLQGPTLAITGDEGLPVLREQDSSGDFDPFPNGRDLQGPTLAITGDEELPVLREQHSSEDFDDSATGQTSEQDADQGSQGVV